MKINTLPVLASMFLFASCIKYSIPIPPPAGGSTNPSGPTAPNIPYGVSAIVNGKYTTFNTSLVVDTSYESVSILGYGDSAGFTNAQIEFDFTTNNAPFVTGIYTYQPNGTPYSSAISISFFGLYNTNIGFTGYTDTLTLTDITDTTYTGTITGPLTAVIDNPNYPYNQYDSTMTFTNGKFYVRK